MQRNMGFSLLEVLISVAILSIGVLALAGFNGNLYKSVRYSNDRAKAMASAQQLIDNYRALDFAQVISGADTTPGGCNQPSPHRIWTVANVAGTTNIKDMSVYVCWTDVTGVKQEMSFSTQIGVVAVAATATSVPTMPPSSNTPAPCTASTYVDGSSYATGGFVRNLGRKYKCTVGGWCTTGGPYAPGTGWAWQNAWSDEGLCE
ncbi:prepilin-type N-terminal cleavage/methylation domain-containing protein [Chitinibacter sp. GC72]|uniref:prepilin-type N-terminal cleavage/methylation domain-containing protein n=1 Tax=Chitinibacter sp. GC72 TaxID=1526917 RepID=UPI0018DF1F2E|nr:prepilin-type N-terminal cleavage/methylation domain-containing protein [Chitinibacter sp. GC72]